MAEVVGKEPPVLIENVNLVINVFNIGHNADLNTFPVYSPACALQSQGLLQQGGLIQASTATASINCSTDASGRILKPSNEPGQVDTKGQFPLGWIALRNGDVIPFGVQPIALEIPSFGDRKYWKEIRVCLPPSLLADNETDLFCPVSTCREKLPKNKSMDSHIKKHLGLSDKESQTPVNVDNGEGSLPCSLVYYCQDKKCQYYVETAEKSFKAYKNVKQHYQKVHAPRLFECEQCQKTFSTQKVLDTHKLMCGEKYACSTCDLSYSTLESLQTHCRRKSHTYDHNKYKDKRNSVKQKQEIQLLKNHGTPGAAAAVSAPTVPSNTTGRKSKTARKLPAILPKVPTPAPTEVLNSIQELCQRAGLKVDLGCQTVCTAFIQKSSPVEAIIPPTTPSFTQKKRKSTDTQTNIVKFRATCIDQKNNATNTNLDWKRVITSDSQTQTADNGEPVELRLSFKPAASTDSCVYFNDEFATFKISETTLSAENSPIPASIATEGFDDVVPLNDVKNEQKSEQQLTMTSSTLIAGESKASSTNPVTPLPIKVNNGPSLFPEFISFLEATDSATQTDPEMFDTLGSGECLGIRGLFGDDIVDTEEDAYVSVSSTASQTAVESVSKSLSAEDYETLLNTTDDKKITDLNSFSEYIKTVEGINLNNNNNIDSENSQADPVLGGSGSKWIGQQGTNDFLFDWEDIVEEVYRDVEECG